MAESVAQQMRNCVCKTQTATTGRQPVQLVLHVRHISWIQHISFSINLKVTGFRVSFAAGYSNCIQMLSYDIVGYFEISLFEGPLYW